MIAAAPSPCPHCGRSDNFSGEIERSSELTQLRQALAEAEGKLKRYTQVSEAGNSAGDELDRIVDLEARLSAAQAERLRSGVWEGTHNDEIAALSTPPT